MHRPAWVELIGAALETGITTILIEKLDRLARDLMVQEHIIADLRRRGVDLISAAEPDLCVDDPSRKLLRQIMGAIAEYDRAMIVLKLRGARQRQRAKVGRCEGAKPYGTLPGELDVLQRIVRLRGEGRTFQQIASALNAEGIAPRRGARWHPSPIARIVTRMQ
jgi:DNA invertase Pin-like site-specific DNA recombinase